MAAARMRFGSDHFTPPCQGEGREGYEPLAVTYSAMPGLVSVLIRLS